MLLSDSISRLRTYYGRHGLTATLGRAAAFVRRSFVASRMVVFYWDLTQPNNSPSATVLPTHLTVERKDSLEQIDPQDWQTIVNFWNPELSSRLFAERLRQGASIWLLRSHGKLAGYGWTLTGGTIRPYFYPLGANDVHLFDFLIFPEFRGQQLNPQLVIHIVSHMASAGRSRAYIEAAEWNHPQLASLKKTGFRLLGLASKTSLFGKTFVAWSSPQGQLETHKGHVHGNRPRVA